MAILQCECGQKLTVPDSLAGRMGKCPTCGRRIRIPAPQAPPVPGDVPAQVPTAAPGRVPVVVPTRSGPRGTARSRYQARAAARAQWMANLVPIVAGAVILATIIIPWAAGRGISGTRGKVLMSWTMIGEMEARDCSYLIGAWVIGAAAIAVSIYVRGLALRLSHVGMGLLGIILFWVAIGARGVSPLGFKGMLLILPGDPRTSGHGTQWWLWFLLITLLLIAINVRFRLGARPSIRVAVGVVAGALAVWTLVRFFITISDFTDMPKSYKESMTLYLIIMLAAMVSMITVCVLALVDVVSLRVDKKVLSLGALRTACATLGAALILPSVIWPLHVPEPAQPGMILYFLNSFAVIAGVLAIFSSGAIALTALLVEQADRRRAAGPAVAAAPAPAASAGTEQPEPPEDDLDARLRKLKALLDNGTISQEEYDTERRRILAGI